MQMTSQLKYLFTLICSASTLLVASPIVADNNNLTVTTEKRELKVSQIASGLDHPWSIAFISSSDWLVTERSGQLRRITDGKLQDQPISGLPKIKQTGQGGLLDVVLHPDFSNNQLVYLSYTMKGGTEVLRGKLTGNKLENTEVIFSALPKMRGGRHFGSRLVFDNQGFLFISLGDRGKKETSQQTINHPGSIIRLNDDGSIPNTNPFVSDSTVLPEIYSYGHRNIQGMTFDPATNILWAHEHGPKGGDELNQVLAGKNYGWPVITYGVNYVLSTKIGEGTEKPGMVQPTTYWDPSIAPSGLAVVDSEKYAEWQGNLLVGALKFQLLARLELADGKVIHEERILKGELGRIRDVRQGPDGFIYLLTDSSNGSVYRLE